jgi:hypothetical protein
MIKSIIDIMSEEVVDMSLFSAPRRGKRKSAASARKPAKAAKAVPTLAPDQDEQTISRIASGEGLSTSGFAPFQALGVGEHLQRVCNSLGMRNPSPVQVNLHALEKTSCA